MEMLQAVKDFSLEFILSACITEYCSFFQQQWRAFLKGTKKICLPKKKKKW